MDTPHYSENQRKIIAELATMFALFPVTDQSQSAQELRLVGYLEAIGGFPAWVVQIARVKVCRGLYPHLNRAFAPSPAEFAEIVRELMVRNRPQSDVPGEISFDGEIPMTWIPEGDPRWDALCRIAKAANPKNKHYPMTSKYVPGGRGSFFRTEYVKAMR